jgi:hypothetical protein
MCIGRRRREHRLVRARVAGRAEADGLGRGRVVILDQLHARLATGGGSTLRE